MDYGGLNAKIKAMRGRLFSHEDYGTLCGAKTVEEFGLALKNHDAYKACLQGIPDADIHREPIEQRITLSLHDDFAKIYKFVSDYRIRKFLSCYFLKNEIRIIKMLLCMVYDDRDISYYLPYLGDLTGMRRHRVDVARLRQARSVPEFIGFLEGTEFHPVLANVYNEKTTLFQLEVQLDIYYFFQLWKNKNKYLNRLDTSVVNRLTGTEVDMQNIMWIYRLKHFYNAPQGLIYTHLIPSHYRLNRERISRMVEAGSSEELWAEISATAYGKAFSRFDKIETAFYHEMARQHGAYEMARPNSLAVALGYIFFKEIEVKNLISIMEGIRYNMEPKDILTLVILKKKGEAG